MLTSNIHSCWAYRPWRWRQHVSSETSVVNCHLTWHNIIEDKSLLDTSLSSIFIHSVNELYSNLAWSNNCFVLCFVELGVSTHTASSNANSCVMCSLQCGCYISYWILCLSSQCFRATLPPVAHMVLILCTTYSNDINWQWNMQRKVRTNRLRHRCVLFTIPYTRFEK